MSVLGRVAAWIAAAVLAGIAYGMVRRGDTAAQIISQAGQRHAELMREWAEVGRSLEGRRPTLWRRLAAVRRVTFK